ncbi:serine hydrolase [Microbacterium sp. AZCO]|uniref:serine hydrolase domain-containing protein n=1 Tax=Microbacterium sp. AZCO TaxID=3142976 RepID=UPI0031F3CA79
MAFPDRHRYSRMIGACMLGVCLMLATACTTTPAAPPAPTPTGTAAIADDVATTLAEHDPYHGIRAVLVLEHGTRVYDRYIDSGPEDYWDIQSVTKSFVGTLVGIAIDHGLIGDVNATLGQLLPRWTDQLTAETSAIPLWAVLTHSANFADGSEAESAGVWSSPDPVATILVDRARRGAGDGSFRYSNAGSHILAAVLAEASGMPVLEFARRYLLDPLGIASRPALEQTVPFAPEDEAAETAAFDDADFAWPRDRQGIHIGAGPMRLRPADLARLGQLYLDRGRWQGVQLVSSSWIDQATAPHLETAGDLDLTDHYGFQWWVASDDHYFAAMGFGGTVILVSPEHDVVVVVASQIDADQPPAHTVKVGNARALAESILAEFATAPPRAELGEPE